MKEQKGITLIALIITIVVMLILVTVSITLAVNSNLFGNAQKAANSTKNAYEAEAHLTENTNITRADGTETTMNQYMHELINNALY